MLVDKMRKYSLSIILFIALLFLAGINLWLVKTLRIVQEEYVQLKEAQHPVNSKKERDLEVNAQLGLLNDGLQLNDLVLTGRDDENVSLKEYMYDKKTVLVIRINELHCSDCVNFILHKVDRLSKELKLTGHILVLASYRNPTVLRIMQNKQETPMPFYNAGQQAIPLPVEKVKFPYCFILDRDLTVRHVFVPDKAAAALSNQYLQGISKRYFLPIKTK